LLKKRFEDNFKLHIALEETNGCILPLTLQMLLENAVKHNIISKTRPLEVEIYLEDKKWIVARNNLQPKNQPEPGTHFGLQSLAERYRLLGNYSVIVERDDRYFTVKVPLIPPI
jgi:LytS/YehU family sensor histidine kinase